MAFRRGHAAGVRFDIAIFAVGCVIAAVDGVSVARGPQVNPALLLAIPLIVVIGLFPIRIHGLGGQMEFACSPAVLIFLAFQAPPAVASVLWVVAYAIYQGIARLLLPTKLLNLGLAVIGGRLLIAVVDSMGTSRLDDRSLAAVVVGTAVYFAVDFLVSYAAISMVQPVRLFGLVRDSGVWIAFAALVGANSVGYTAVVLEHVRWFALLLIAPPMGAVFVASRMYEQANRHRSRLEALFAAAVRTHQAAGAAEIEAVLVDQARNLLYTSEARMRETPPVNGEIGVLVPGLDGRYLVAPPRLTNRAYDDVDRASLATLVTIATESLDRSSLVADMARMARSDALTGLGNRILFQERLDQALLVRVRTPTPLILLYLDLDGFKPVNDLLGHHVGDALLVAVGHRIVSVVRAGNTVARIGGDEFVVLLEDCLNQCDVEVVCGRLADAIAQPVEAGGHSVRVTASIGVASWSAGDTADELLRRADHEMYRRKRAARQAADGSQTVAV